MLTVLVIDDDRTVPHLVRQTLARDGLEVQHAESVRAGLEFARSGPDVVLIDVVLPDACGLDAVPRLRELAPGAPVIVVTATGTSETAIAAMKQGAFDYFLKPLVPEQIRRAVLRAVQSGDSSGPVANRARRPGVDSSLIIGSSGAMQDVFKAIGRVAPQSVSVLILGESGTGKELVAQAIHQHSSRAAQPFLAVNCAALPESLLESELFGHEQGAFTGAEARHIGRFERCDGGTLFLDEIGDMPPLVQCKLLRVLQEQVFERVGGQDSIRTDVRVVAATNRDLATLTTLGKFREDLYYRLAGFTIVLPPLRSRGDDVTLLIEHLLWKLSSELGKDECRLTPEAEQLLRSYDWPGNVRELETVLRQALLLTPGRVVIRDCLPAEIRQGSDGHLFSSEQPASDLAPFVERRLRHNSRKVLCESQLFMERYVLTRILRESGGNQSQASRLLGITRGCLRSRIRELGITVGTRVHVEADDSPGDA